MPYAVNSLDEARRQGRLWTPDLLPVKPRVLLETNKFTIAGTTTATSVTTRGSLLSSMAPYSGGTGPTIAADAAVGGRILRNTTTNVGISGSFTAAAVNDQTFFCIRKRTAGGTTRGLFGYDWSVGGGYLLAWAFYDTISGGGTSGNLTWVTGQVVWFTNQNNDGMVANTGQGNGVWFSSLAQAGVATPIYRENGTAQSITDSSSLAHAARTTRPFVIFDSFDNTSSTEEWMGDIAVFALWPDKFSVRNIERIEGYYHWACGMQSKLPGSHIFRNRPPLIGV
jgi:hypothetical protein